MPELRTIATFRSTRFVPPGDGLVAADDPLVKWVVDGLRRTTDFQVHESDNQDWGTVVRVEYGRAEYRLNFAVSDASPPDWMLEVQDPPRLLKSIFGRQDPLVHGRLIETVHAVLSSDPGMSELRWHLGSAFGRGDRSTAAAVPDRVAAV